VFHLKAKKIDEARPVFERLVNQFPTSGRYWKLYIEQEVSYLWILYLECQHLTLDIINDIDTYNL
jgi:hypothetical protein